MLRQICAVLDKVTLLYHEDFEPEERSQLLMMCVPEKEIRFRAILDTYKPGERIRQSRADVDLMRIIRLWFEADKDNSGELEMDEVGSVLNTLGISINARDLKALFAKVDTSGDGSVQFDEFYELYTDATTIGVVRNIFDFLSSKKPSAREVFEPIQGQQTLEFSVDPDSYRPKKGGKQHSDIASSIGSMRNGAQAFKEGGGNLDEHNNNTDDSIKMQPLVDEEGNVMVDEKGQPRMIPVERNLAEEARKKQRDLERKEKVISAVLLRM